MKENPATINPQNVAQQIYIKNVELLKERRHAEQLLYSVSDIVFAINTEHKLTLVNHTGRNLLNLNPETVLNQPVDQVISLKYEKGIELTAKDYAFQVEPSKTIVDGLILKTPYGEMFVNLKTSIITENEKFSECVVTLSDVTKEKMLEKAKDEFVNIASHELRSPLTVIKSYLWILSNKKAGDLNEKQTGYLDKAIKGTERMLALVNDYLDVARIEQGRITLNLEPTNLKEFISEIYDEFKIKTDEKSLALNIAVPDALPLVYADKVRLREVLVNLVSNAVKFTGTGGVTIKIENDNPSLGEVKINVIDTGRGIKQEDMSKLFAKFSRLESPLSTGNDAGGTGLGLYITKSLIGKMGGKIGLESEGIGKGSTFWCTLLTESSKDKITSLVI